MDNILPLDGRHGIIIDRHAIFVAEAVFQPFATSYGTPESSCAVSGVLVSAAAGSAANSPAAITAAAARLAVRSFRVPFKIYSSFKVNIINYHHTTTA